jgi:hypothetical protein
MFFFFSAVSACGGSRCLRPTIITPGLPTTKTVEIVPPEVLWEKRKKQNRRGNQSLSILWMEQPQTTTRATAVIPGAFSFPFQCAPNLGSKSWTLAVACPFKIAESCSIFNGSKMVATFEATRFLCRKV